MRMVFRIEDMNLSDCQYLNLFEVDPPTFMTVVEYS